MEISPKIIIIIVNYNGATDTIECLKSIIKSNNKDYKTIVVDNHSDIENYNLLNDFCITRSEVILLRAPQNGGFAYGNNIGIKYGFEHFPNCSLYWLLNNDTKIFPETIGKLLDFSTNCSMRIGIMGNKMNFYDNPNLIQAIGGKFNKYTCRCSHIGAYENDANQTFNTKFDYVVGASMLVRKVFIESVGVMNEDYFLFFEELDWIERGKKFNWAIAIDESNRILHKEGGSTNSRKKMSIKISRIQLRSRILFMKRFYPMYLPISLSAMMGMIIKYLFKGDVRHSFSLFKTLLKTMVYEK